MTFDEFWEKNYAKDFGECEPYYGIASHAFEVGKQNYDCVCTDNSAVIEKLQKDKKELEIILEATQRNSVIRFCENRKLEEQIEKMKCCGNCQYCDGDNPCKWHRQNTQCENFHHWKLRAY